MTDHEIQMLALGTALGMYLMLLLQIGLEIHADRRARKARRAREHEKGWALVPTPGGDQRVRQADEPHPAELLEAAVRDFELKLYDAVDRVEDAARRDGLL